MKFLFPLLAVLLAVFAVAPLEYPGAIESHTGLQATYNLIDLDQHPLQFFAWAPTVGQAFDLFRIDGSLPYVIAELVHLMGFSYLDATKLVYALAWIASTLTMFALARRFLSEEGAFLAAVVYVYLPFHIAATFVRGAFAESVAWAIFPIALLSILSSQRAKGLPKQEPVSPQSRGGRGEEQKGTQHLLGESWLFQRPSNQAFSVAGRVVLMLVPTALLFLAVPGLAILFTIAAAAIAAALRWRERDWKGILLPAGGGLLLGLLLYLPTLFRYGAAVVGDGFNPNYVLPFQLFSSLWGLATSTGSYLDHFPLQIGVVPVGLAIVALALAWRKPSAVESNETPGTSQPIDEGPRQTDAVVGAKPGLDDPAGDKTDAARDAPSVPIDRSALVRAVIIFLVAAVVFALLTFEIAAPIWNVLGLFATYPWQILAFVGLALAVAAGSVIDFEPSFSRPAMLAFFVALPVVLSYGYLAPNYLDYAPTRPQIAVFGRNEIALWDYRIVGPLRHGATLRVYLTWQALGVVDHDYTVFIHAVNADGNTYGQVDTKPVDGTMPTYKWQPGQVVSDTQTIQIDVDGPREGYHLELGLYQAANGERAPIVGGGDALILPRPGDPEPVISEVLPTDSN